MNEHIQRQCTKVFYSPLEAAIRWSDLLEHETEILDWIRCEFHGPPPHEHWPQLLLNVERLFDAMKHGELPFGTSGITQCAIALLNAPDLTLRHVDLRRWMVWAYPTLKPHFLFDEAERRSSVVLDQETALALSQHLSLIREQAQTRVSAETQYLNIIGALLTLLLGHSSSGERYSTFNTLGSVVGALITHHSGRPGINEQTLWAKFAEAKRHLCAQPPERQSR